jgi:hypothetical protein
MNPNLKAWLIALGMVLAFGAVGNIDYICELEKENAALKLRVAGACGGKLAGVSHEKY